MSPLHHNISVSPGFTYNEDGETIISEEEFLEIKNLKTFKQNYRMHHEDLKALKAEIQYCQKLVDQCRHKLVKGEYNDYRPVNSLYSKEHVN